MATISTEGTPVALQSGSTGSSTFPISVSGHLLLVRRDDTGSEFVIRGGPTSGGPDYGNLIVEVNEPIETSIDRRIVQLADGTFRATTPAERGSATIDFAGRDPDSVWQILIQHAENIHNQGLPYDPLGFNSNGTVGNLLSVVGIEIDDFVPDPDGIMLIPFSGKNRDFNFDYQIDGTNDADLIVGRGGKQQFNGGMGADTLRGGSGNDTLAGDAQDDNLDGGDGEDAAIFSGPCSDYDITRDAASGDLIVSHVRGSRSDGTDRLKSIETGIFKDGKVDLTAEDPSCGPTDFIFLVDLSGSFQDDLPRFQASAREIAASLRASDADSRFALASFVDLPRSPFGSPGDYLYKSELALTDSVAAFESALSRLVIKDGGDTPEAQLVGLWRAANGVGLSLRENSKKVILLATDAPAHNAASYGLNESTIRSFLDDEGIAVTPFAALRTSVAAADDGEALMNPEEPLDEASFRAAASLLGDGELAAFAAAAPDLMVQLLNDLMRVQAVQPIFAVTAGNESFYNSVVQDTGRGTTVRLAGDSSNVSDALRAALLVLDGTVTASGDEGANTLIGTEADDVIVGLGGADRIEGRAGNDNLDGGSGNDLIFGEDGADTLLGGSGNDTVLGGAGDDGVNGGLGSDILGGGDGNDTLNGGEDATERDFLFGGAGNDTYQVRGSLSALTDLVYEGDALLAVAAGVGDVDTIVSRGLFYRDFYSVAERLVIDEQANVDNPSGTYLVGGAGPGPTEIIGNSGVNYLIAYGGTNIVRPGAGDDAISFELFDLTEFEDGVNTLALTPGTGRDFVYGFELGVDKVDLRAYAALTADVVLGSGTTVDGDTPYSHFYLGEAGGVFDYVAFVGFRHTQLSASDFIFA